MINQTKKPKISVLTPAYNAEQFIGETIECILNQSFKDFEFIIIDDCSIDSTAKIIKSFQKKDDRIKYFKNKKNLGIAGNRNKGLGLAAGKYVVWQDADDISLPNRLKKQYEFMEKHPKVGICGGYLQFFDETGNRGVRKYATKDESLRKNIFRFSPVAQPAAILRKSCIDEAGKYDLRWPPAEDLDMSFRIGSKHKFANLAEIIIKYREHGNSATFKRLKTMELNTINIRKIYSKGWGYHPTFADYMYNVFQYISIFIVPPKLKIAVFNKLRNSK